MSQPSPLAILWSFICEAYVSTCQTLDWHKKWGLVFALMAAVPVTWFYRVLLGDGKAVSADMNTVIAGLAALGTVGLFLFIVNLIHAPFVIVTEKNKAIGDLGARVKALEDKIKPVISVLYEGNRTAPYYHTDEGERFKLLRIGIRNDGYTHLEGVRAKLMGVKQLKEDTAEPLFSGKFPAALHLKGDNPPNGS
jgi:hypothetical protein